MNETVVLEQAANIVLELRAGTEVRKAERIARLRAGGASMRVVESDSPERALVRESLDVLTDLAAEQEASLNRTFEYLWRLECGAYPILGEMEPLIMTLGNHPLVEKFAALCRILGDDTPEIASEMAAHRAEHPEWWAELS